MNSFLFLVTLKLWDELTTAKKAILMQELSVKSYTERNPRKCNLRIDKKFFSGHFWDLKELVVHNLMTNQKRLSRCFEMEKTYSLTKYAGIMKAKTLFSLWFLLLSSLTTTPLALAKYQKGLGNLSCGQEGQKKREEAQGSAAQRCSARRLLAVGPRLRLSSGRQKAAKREILRKRDGNWEVRGQH